MWSRGRAAARAACKLAAAAALPAAVVSLNASQSTQAQKLEAPKPVPPAKYERGQAERVCESVVPSVCLVNWQQRGMASKVSSAFASVECLLTAARLQECWAVVFTQVPVLLLAKTV